MNAWTAFPVSVSAAAAARTAQAVSLGFQVVERSAAVPVSAGRRATRITQRDFCITQL